MGSTPAIQRYNVGLYRIRTQEITAFCGEDLYSSLGDVLLDGRLLHNHWADPEPVCGRLLGSTPAIQRYKVRLYRIKTQEIAVFCGEALYSNPGVLLLYGVLLHNCLMDFDALCGRLLGLMPAMQRYKVRLCRIKTQESANPSKNSNIPEPDCRFLCNRSTDFDSVRWRLLSSMPATQRYKVCLCRIKTQESANPSESSNVPELNCRFLGNHLTDFDSVCRRFLGSPLALQRYKIHPSAIFIHDVTGSWLGRVPGG